MHSSHTANMLPPQTGLLNLKINVAGREITPAVDIFCESTGRTKSQFYVAPEGATKMD